MPKRRGKINFTSLLVLNSFGSFRLIMYSFPIHVYNMFQVSQYADLGDLPEWNLNFFNLIFGIDYCTFK